MCAPSSPQASAGTTLSPWGPCRCPCPWIGPLAYREHRVEECSFAGSWVVWGRAVLSRSPSRGNSCLLLLHGLVTSPSFCKDRVRAGDQLPGFSSTSAALCWLWVGELLRAAPHPVLSFSQDHRVLQVFPSRGGLRGSPLLLGSPVVRICPSPMAEQGCAVSGQSSRVDALLHLTLCELDFPSLEEISLSLQSHIGLSARLSVSSK